MNINVFCFQHMLAIVMFMCCGLALVHDGSQENRLNIYMMAAFFFCLLVRFARLLYVTASLLEGPMMISQCGGESFLKE